MSKVRSLTFMVELMMRIEMSKSSTSTERSTSNGTSSPDQMPDDPIKGEFNERFGLYVDRDFYIISEMPDNRYLDLINTR